MEKLKQKVASSSSRVIASLQQAATGTFQIPSHQQQQHPAQAEAQAEAQANPASIHQHAQELGPGGGSMSLVGPSQGQQLEPASTFIDDPLLPARLVAAGATAHLTKEEQEILLQVFKKEEQFQRDTINQMSHQSIRSPPAASHNHHSGQTNSSRAAGGMVTGRENRKSSAQQNQFSRSNRQTVAANAYSSVSSSQYSTASLSGAESVTASGANSPFTSARSTTPLSSQQHQHQRAQSSCSNVSSLASGSNHATNNMASLGGAAATSLTTPRGQCRICRKSIFANETCHLCSACNQFVCEDCGSYSASDQHWMCSSCRRRATKPAIPADALKELGLNQNSSAVRRMTLRLNQADLKLALGKASSESSASSSSSSGCSSSQSTATNKAPQKQQQQQQHIQAPTDKDHNGATQLALKRTQGRKQPPPPPPPAAVMVVVALEGTKGQQQQTRTRATKQEPEPEVGGGSKAKSLRGLAGQKMERTSRVQQQQPVVGQRARVSGASDVNNNDHYHHHKQPQQQQQQNHMGPTKQQQQLAPQALPVGQIMMEQACDRRRVPGDGQGQRQSSVEVQRQQQQQLYQQYQRRSSAVDCGGDSRNGAQKTLSQPVGGGRKQDFVTDMEHGAGGEHANKADPRNRSTARTMLLPGHEPGGQVQQQQQPPSLRRASVASPEHAGGLWTGSGLGASGGQTAMHWRQQSGSIFSQNNNPNCLQPTYDEHEAQSSSMTSIPQQQFVQPQTMVTASSDASLDGGGCGPQHFGGTTTAAAPGPRFRHGSLTTINNLQHHSAPSVPMPTVDPNLVQDQDMLVPMPSEQMMHVRRLSDQSNLIRRSSVISEIMMGGISSAQRIRSHSNIDNMDTFPSHQLDFQTSRQQQHQQPAVAPTGYTNWMPPQQQQQQSARPTNNNGNTNFRGMSTDDSTTFGPHEGHKLNVAGYAIQQRRPSDQWVLQQHVAAQQEALAYTAKEYQSAVASQPGANRMSSIITPYAQKRRQASEEMNSDSSSDIEETAGDPQRGSMEFDNIDRSSEYFAPPAMSSYDHDYMMGYQQQQQQHQYPQYQHTIPSVSVSEFNSSQQRLNQINNGQQHQQQPNQMHEMYQQSNNLSQPSGAYDQIMTTPMEVNLAIEQAIQQQLQQQHHQQRRLSNEYLACNSYLLPRRGSSGRVLPKVPGEQSRSLLDLPCDVQEQQQHDQQQKQNGLTSGPTDRAGSRGQLSTLDLPCQTIRRASAPEGQNIRIVVDDMDEASMMMMQMGGQYGRKQSKHSINGVKGELYERLVLYRDDTLDPNASMAHGFGLQVMGGKMDDDEKKLQAFVSWILPGGPADKVGLKQGDIIIEWDGKCLINMSYEQVADVIESSANIAELLVKPAQRLDTQPGLTNLVRSQRRMSQQTERDFKRIQQTTNGEGMEFDATNGTSGRRMSSMGHQQEPPSNRRDSLRMYSSSTVSINHQRPQDGCSQYSRSVGGATATSTTTRRRLPQIPGLNQEGDPAYQPQLPSRDGHASSMVMNLTKSTGPDNYGLLSAVANNYNQQQQQQHSVSTSELYQSRGAPINTTSASSIGVLNNPSSTQQTTWQANNNNDMLYGPHMAQPSQPAPGTYLSPSSDVCGLIGLQVNVDERLPQLEVSVLNAINIGKNPSFEYYVRVKILPESKLFKACTTQPSCDMNWKETFIFQNFPIQQIQRMALEIGIWIHDEAPRLSAYGAQPLCEALIPIHGAAERNTDFWPLRPPPSSPQSRRKSLNDLMESRGHLDSMHLGARGHQQQEYSQPSPCQLIAATSAGRMGQMDNLKASATFNKTTTTTATTTTTNANGSGSSALRIQGQENIKYPSDLNVRDRTCSNKNLPDLTGTASSNTASGNRLRVQPRRASDELTGSSLRNHRCLSSRVSPAASRRSISIINVADGPQPTALLLAGSRSLAPSRPGGNATVVAGPQNSSRGAELGQSSFGDSPVGGGKFNFPNTSTTTTTRASGTGETQQIGASSSGRRCSLIGVQSLSGYRSQRGSQSGSNDLDSPRQLAQSGGSGGSPQKRLPQSQQHQSPTGALVQVASAAPSPPGYETRQPQQQQQQRHRGSVAGLSQTSSGGVCGGSGPNGSRRGSIEPGYQGQRRGSFAMQTLRKLKRTMSLTKGGGDQDNEGSNQDSRRSSSTSADSSYDVREDVGIPRKLLAHCKQGGSIGKLKLSFILTKGQLEIEVICAQELKFELDSSLGVYVKLYLRGGKSRTNKRKTRIVPPTEAPIFKQIIKYDGSLVDNKTLDISVWQKQSALKGKMPIGFTEVQLVELSLEQLLTSWYNLRPMEIACNSSLDE